MKKRIGSYLINTISIISGILTIITFWTSVFNISFKKINIIIDLNYFFGRWSLWIFIIALTILVFSILVKLNLKKRELLERENFFVEFSQLLLFLQKNCKIRVMSGTSEADKFMQEALDKITRILSVYGKGLVYANLKSVIDQDGEKYVKTQWESSNVRSLDNNNGLQKINDNTIFYNLIKGKRSYSCLSTNNKLLNKFYKISDKNWRRKYSSTLVVPIKKVDDDKDIFVGFLCLYSIDKDVFEVNRTLIISMVQTIASYLGLILTIN